MLSPQCLLLWPREMSLSPEKAYVMVETYTSLCSFWLGWSIFRYDIKVSNLFFLEQIIAKLKSYRNMKGFLGQLCKCV